MISPWDTATAKNCVMQLHMGEGKSSVIIPILCVSLADREKLVRVIVPMPLSKEMLNYLARLSGLINRKIFYLPFSRTTRITVDSLRQIR